jgi:hypothetical protein
MVNIMHKFELGVWKALFSHLVCILYVAAPSGKLVALLDERYSQLSLGCGIAIWFDGNHCSRKKVNRLLIKMFHEGNME